MWYIMIPVIESQRKTAKIDEFSKIVEIFEEKVLTIPSSAYIIVERPKTGGFYAYTF